MKTNPTASKEPHLLSVRRIWDKSPHNAFTDLVRFRDRWYCVFREADRHAGGEDGRIRVLVSADGEAWDSAALLEEEGIDLRDPKLTVTPGDKLLLLAGGSVYQEGVCVTRRTRTAVSCDGLNWPAFTPVLDEGQWLWRLTWTREWAYGISRGDDGSFALFRTADGVSFERVCDLDVDGRPNETTLRFLDDGRMAALVRREEGDQQAWFGVSDPPFKNWSWRPAGRRVGGPNFVVLRGGVLWAAGREYGERVRTMLGPLDDEGYHPVLELPSAGDSSYPGMVFHDGLLWFSYYSTHEGQTSIYLAKIAMP